ncbi:hypothetical protein [Shimia sediminis]|uniref:hypothetical protein n=1 Tax=Shimia sediminis TaxID=2497945 RepID=UPI000F8C42A7|nr:hypothetical protein [Shimia sediminis]
MIRIFLALLFLSGPAMAATLERTDNPNCTARFSGPIKPGDFEKVAAAAAQILKPDPDDPEGNTYFMRVCLDSPGGSLLEATEIAAHFSEKGYGTVIDNGDSCYSACAVIFMFGSQYFTGRTVNFNRRLHVNGILGFHRPDFRLPEGGSYSSADVEQAFDIAILATHEFIRLGNRRIEGERNVYFAADLIELMFSREGNDFFYVDTVDKAGRWSIDVFGYAQPRAISARDAIVACHNMSNWTYRLSPEPVELRRSQMDTMMRDVSRVVHRWDDPAISYDDNPPQSYYVRTGPVYHKDWLLKQADRTCLIQPYFLDGELSLTGCGGNNDAGTQAPNLNRCDVEDGDLMRPISALAVFPSHLPLSGLSQWAATMTEEATTIDAMDHGGPQSWCTRAQGYTTRVVNVSEYVNIRQDPGFNAPVVAQAGKHLVMTFGSGDPMFVGDRATQNRCIQACNTLHSAGVRDDTVTGPVAQCMSDNAIWFDVVLPNGIRGWISGKYTDQL